MRDPHSHQPYPSSISPDTPDRHSVLCTCPCHVYCIPLSCVLPPLLICVLLALFMCPVPLSVLPPLVISPGPLSASLRPASSCHMFCLLASYALPPLVMCPDLLFAVALSPSSVVPSPVPYPSPLHSSCTSFSYPSSNLTRIQIFHLYVRSAPSRSV